VIVRLRRLRQEGAPLAVLGASAGLYVVVFGWLTWQQQRNYGTFGFDMGIHDQGIWLLSRFEDPYVTVVGRNYLGHHFNLVGFLYVPFYWLGAGPTFLYFTQTMFLALGAVPVYLLARDQLGNRWLGTAFGAAYLLHPTIQWINWWHFHPDALMVTPLLFAWWFATKARWRAFAVCCFLAVCAKEDATTAIVMMGVVLLIRHWRTDKRIGLYTIGAGAAWFLVATKLLMPWFNNGELAFYEDFFPGLGSGLGEIVHNALRHPSRLYDPMLGRSTSDGNRDPAAVEAFRENVYRYYQRLLLPMGILALRKPTLLLIGLPMLVINVMSSLSYTHDAKFHYSAIIVVAVVLASIEGCAAYGRRKPDYVYITLAAVLAFVLIGSLFADDGSVRVAVIAFAAGLVAIEGWAVFGPQKQVYSSVAVGVLCAFALYANVNWSPSPLNDSSETRGVWAREWGQDVPAATPPRDRMVALVPGEVGLSATYALIPHLTHRSTAYEFPNPWWIVNWLDCKTTPDPARVDYLVVDTSVLGTVTDPAFGMSPKGLFETLTDPVDGEFAVIGEEGGVVVAERVRPAELSFDSPRPKCD
jgi:uncharacterized membrane protein